jgi:hypothetical protein
MFIFHNIIHFGHLIGRTKTAATNMGLWQVGRTE